MTVGIIAEGRGDHAVLTNILKGEINLDGSEIQYMLPDFHFDQTDLHTMQVNEFGSWTRVRQECLTRELIAPFFETFADDERFLVIQIDTAERNLINFEVNDPPIIDDKVDYCRQLRENVINRINLWLDNNYVEHIRYAIAIEETEAWILALSEYPDTSRFRNPKERLSNELNRRMNPKEKRRHFQKSMFDQYEILSRPLRRKKDLTRAKQGNESLNLFCLSLDTYNNPSRS